MRKLDQARSRALALRRRPARPHPKAPAPAKDWPGSKWRRPPEPTRDQRKAARRAAAEDRP
ncbi:MAG: hypothetical protein RIB84_23770 [Sneathiellaceae bacterium]